MTYLLGDGRGPLPDSNLELALLILTGLTVVAFFTAFTSLDAHARYVSSAPSDYLFSAPAGSVEGELYMTSGQVELLNEVSSGSIGLNPSSAERLYCGTIRGDTVRRLRLADFIESSSLESVKGSCVSGLGGVDIWIHTHPGSGNGVLSEEDKSLEDTSAEYTCVQFAEISASPVSGLLGGISCYDVSSGFSSVPVYLKN